MEGESDGCHVIISNIYHLIPEMERQAGVVAVMAVDMVVQMEVVGQITTAKTFHFLGELS